MAPAGALLLLLLLLPEGWWWLREGARGEHFDDIPVSAPPELLALLPAAAKATVSAGYTEEAGQRTNDDEVSFLAQTRSRTTSDQEKVFIVGDTRYAWQEWSRWHCNCHAGSMSRVRDISYSAPSIHLDPAQYDILRFQRELCSYTICGCNRKKHECDMLALTCNLGAMHMCAIQDIQQDQSEKRRLFWTHVHGGLKNLLRSLKATFPSKQASQMISSR